MTTSYRIWNSAAYDDSWLDANTRDGSVYLSRHLNGGYTGTRWSAQPTEQRTVYYLQCHGSNAGPTWLAARGNDVELVEHVEQATQFILDAIGSTPQSFYVRPFQNNTQYLTARLSGQVLLEDNPNPPEAKWIFYKQREDFPTKLPASFDVVMANMGDDPGRQFLSGKDSEVRLAGQIGDRSSTVWTLTFTNLPGVSTLLCKDNNRYLDADRGLVVLGTDPEAWRFLPAGNDLFNLSINSLYANGHTDDDDYIVDLKTNNDPSGTNWLVLQPEIGF